MKKSIKFLSLMLTFFVMSVAFTACSDDDDAPDDTSYYDFSIEWDIVDEGDLTFAEAQQFAASLSSESEGIFEGMTEADAIKVFNEFCEQLRYELSDFDLTITLKAKLVRVEGRKILATKIFYVKPDGTTMK